MNERQLIYLETLRATGNPSRSRQAAGVTRRQVSNWERDERFAEEAEEAQSAANDALLQRAREMAMAGDASVMNTWMKALIPSLRPPATNVALGVQVSGGAGSSKLAALSDDELWQRVAQIKRDREMRGEVVDVEALPSPASASQDSGEGVDSLEAGKRAVPRGEDLL